MLKTTNAKVDTAFFKPDELERVISYYHYMFDDNPNRLTTKAGCWQPSVYKQNKAEVYVYHLTEFVDQDIFGWLSSLLKERLGKEIVDMRYYQYLPGTSVGWHDDNHTRGAASIYLQKDWKKEYGGLFMWEETDGSGIHAVVPEQNTMIYQEGCWHATTPTYHFSPDRIVLQVFF